MDVKNIASSVGLPIAAAGLGSIATASGTRSAWYRHLSKPGFQPPAIVFPVVWTVLYAHTAIASAIAQDAMDDADARRYRIRLAVNMALNAGWCWTFFKAQRPAPSIAVAGALTASSIDLVRTAGRASRPAGGFLVPYTAWNGFATVLTTTLWRKNRHRPLRDS